MRTHQQIYAEVLDELALVPLKKKEAKLFRAIVDNSLGIGNNALRVTKKKDLEEITGILDQNIIEPLKSLVSMQMLLYTETDTGWIFWPNQDVSQWKYDAWIDRRVYYRSLRLLRHYNQGDLDPALYLTTLEPDKKLTEAVAEISIEAARLKSFSPIRSASPQAGAYHPDRDGSTCTGTVEGGNTRESARAVTKGSTPAKAGVEEPSKSSQSLPIKAILGPAQSVPVNDKDWRPGKLWDALEKGLIDGAEYSNQVLASPGAHRKINPEYSNQVPGVLKSSTPDQGITPDGPLKPPEKGREYSNQVPEVLKSSTPLNDNNSTEVNEISLNDSNGTGGLLETIRTLIAYGELLKAIQLLGGFTSPDGRNFEPFWKARVRDCRAGVERVLADVLCTLREEPARVENSGGYMSKMLRDWGYWAPKSKRGKK